jgi:hypothetical protein
MATTSRFTPLVAFLVASLLWSVVDLHAFELFPRPQDQYTVKHDDHYRLEQERSGGSGEAPKDSLESLSRVFYGNPSLWPFLWNQNPSVQLKGDEDLPPEKRSLKPGTQINLYDDYRKAPFVNQEFQPPTGLPEEARFLVRKIPSDGIPYGKKYFRYKLSKKPTRIWGYIVSTPEVNKEHLLERDLVYIRFRPSKRQCILVGDRFGIFRERGPLNHVLDMERSIGYFSEVVGEVEITSVGHELVTAIVLESYVEIVRGDKVTLFVPSDKEIVPSKTHVMLTGTILRSATRETDYTDAYNLENDIVFIDKGECDGMKEGTLLNIYRPGRPVEDPHFFERVPVPDRYVGEGMVLKAFEKNSTLLITRSREEVLPGDIIKSVSD